MCLKCKINKDWYKVRLDASTDAKKKLKKELKILSHDIQKLKIKLKNVVCKF